MRQQDINEGLLKEKLDIHERRIGNHADRLDKPEIYGAARRATKTAAQTFAAAIGTALEVEEQPIIGGSGIVLIQLY